MSESVADAVPVLGPARQYASDLRADDLRGVAADLLTLSRQGPALITDPIGVLRGAGLGFLLARLRPLVRLIDLVTGDSAQLRAAAHQWREAAASAGDVGRLALAAMTAGTADWRGTAADQCRQRTAQLDSACREMGQECRQIAGVLEASAAMMATAHDIVVGIVTALVQELLAGWAAAQAAATVTLGASEAAFDAAAPVRIMAATESAAANADHLAALLAALDEALFTATMFMVRVPHALDVTGRPSEPRPALDAPPATGRG
jgi:hypothetical protein